MPRVKVSSFEEEKPTVKVTRDQRVDNDPKVPSIHYGDTAESVPLYYRERLSGRAELEIVRRYFVGRVPLAFVEVFRRGYGRDMKDGRIGKYVVHMTDGSMGNGGVAFATEEALHAFVEKALKDKPTP